MKYDEGQASGPLYIIAMLSWMALTGMALVYCVGSMIAFIVRSIRRQIEKGRV